MEDEIANSAFIEIVYVHRFVYVVVCSTACRRVLRRNSRIFAAADRVTRLPRQRQQRRRRQRAYGCRCNDDVKSLVCADVVVDGCDVVTKRQQKPDVGNLLTYLLDVRPPQPVYQR